MWEKKYKNKKKNTKTIRWYPPESPYPHLNISQPPTTHPLSSIPSTPSTFNNHIMNVTFLVQLKTSNKCWNVRNDEIINLHLGSGAGQLGQNPLLLARHQPNLLISSAQIVNQSISYELIDKVVKNYLSNQYNSKESLNKKKRIAISLLCVMVLLKYSTDF